MFKSYRTFLLFFGLLLSGCGPGFQFGDSTYVPSGIWSVFDPGDSQGLNYDANENEYAYGALGIGNKVFVASAQYPTSNIRQIRLRQFDGTSWSFVDGPNHADTFNYMDSQSAYWPSRLIEYDGKAVIAWREFLWSGGAAGAQLRVASTDGTSTTFLSGTGVVGLNYAGNVSIYGNEMAVHDGDLYIIWHESSLVRAKKFDGTTWTWIDGGGAAGLNYSTGASDFSGELASYGDHLYAAWLESNGTAVQVRVRRYDGTAWEWVDGGGANGINFDPSKAASTPRFFVYKSQLYLIWSESDGTKLLLRLKKFNGSTWDVADGGTALNYDAGNDAYAPDVYVDDHYAFIAWYEMVGGVGQIRVKYFNGSTFTSADGGGLTGLNLDTTRSAVVPLFGKFGTNLILAWYEYNGTKYIVRAKKMQ